MQCLSLKKKNNKQPYAKNKTYLKSECSSTTKSSESGFRIKKKKTKPTLDPMNVNIDLVTFKLYKKKFPH